MKKILEKQWSGSSSFKRKLTYDYYINKYFNLFMNAYKFTGIDNEQEDYILRKFWSVGNVAAFIVEGTKLPEDGVPSNLNEYPNGMIAFAPFAPTLYNIYDWPIKGVLVASRGATFIPTGMKIVNKDVVIGYAQKSKKSILSIVDFYVNKITDTEMTITQQLKAHKCPWLLATTPENEEKIRQLFNRIENDEDCVYLSASEIEALKTLQTGNVYIIDKLFQYKTSLENELLTILGIDNLGSIEKKEHLVVDEANANNEIINDHSDNFLTSLEGFCERISKYLGYNISVEATSSPVVSYKDDSEEENEEGEEENE